MAAGGFLWTVFPEDHLRQSYGNYIAFQNNPSQEVVSKPPITNSQSLQQSKFG
jgi:hypothetical protein